MATRVYGDPAHASREKLNVLEARCYSPSSHRHSQVSGSLPFHGAIVNLSSDTLAASGKSTNETRTPLVSSFGCTVMLSIRPFVAVTFASGNVSRAKGAMFCKAPRLLFQSYHSRDLLSFVHRSNAIPRTRTRLRSRSSIRILRCVNQEIVAFFEKKHSLCYFCAS